MAVGEPDKCTKKLKKSVHLCPQCGFSINLEEIGLRAATTGLVTCPTCDSSGPVLIGTAEKETD
jgi:hypothetical protein